MRLEISFSRPTYHHTVARIKTVSLTNWFRIARCLLTSGVDVRATRATIQDRDPEITRSPDIWTTCIYGYRGPGILDKFPPARGSKRPVYRLNDYGLSCFVNACFAGLLRERMALSTNSAALCVKQRLVVSTTTLAALLKSISRLPKSSALLSRAMNVSSSVTLHKD